VEEPRGRGGCDPPLLDRGADPHRVLRPELEPREAEAEDRLRRQGRLRASGAPLLPRERLRGAERAGRVVPRLAGGQAVLRAEAGRGPGCGGGRGARRRLAPAGAEGRPPAGPLRRERRDQGARLRARRLGLHAVAAGGGQRARRHLHGGGPQRGPRELHRSGTSAATRWRWGRAAGACASPAATSTTSEPAA
jgi:hypothetical protein